MRNPKSRRRLGPALVLCLTMAACGQAGKSGKAASSDICPNPNAPSATTDHPDTKLTGNVTFWGWDDSWSKMVAPFEKAYPNVHVKFVNVDSENISTKFLTSMRAGRGAPDVVGWQDFPNSTQLDNLPVADLTACMKPYMADFPAYILKVIEKPDGTVKSVPWDAGPVSLDIRTDVFKKYGIDPASLTTWDAYIAAGKKLVQASNGKYHMMESNQVEPPDVGVASMAHDLDMLVQQNGGNFFDTKGNPTFTDPKNIQALELLKRFRDEGITKNDVASGPAAVQTLKDGDVASYLAPIWWKSYPAQNAPETSGKWATIPLPAFEPGGARASNLGGTSMVMTKGKNAQAAWAFLRFWLLTTQGRQLSFKASDGAAFMSLFKPVQNDSMITAPDPFYGGERVMADASKRAEGVPQLNLSPKSDFVDDAVEHLLPRYLKGDMNAEQMLKGVQDAVMAR